MQYCGSSCRGVREGVESIRDIDNKAVLAHFNNFVSRARGIVMVPLKRIVSTNPAVI